MWAPALNKLEQYFFWMEKSAVGPPPKYCQQSMDFFQVQLKKCSIAIDSCPLPVPSYEKLIYLSCPLVILALLTLLTRIVPQKLQVLDPTQASSLDLSLEVFQTMVLFESVPEVQIETYIEEVETGTIKRGKTCLTDFWHGRRSRAPELTTAAIASLSIPCHSAEVERSFSSYTQVMIPQRTNLKDSTLKLLNQMVYNNK